MMYGDLKDKYQKFFATYQNLVDRSRVQESMAVEVLESRVSSMSTQLGECQEDTKHSTHTKRNSYK